MTDTNRGVLPLAFASCLLLATASPRLSAQESHAPEAVAPVPASLSEARVQVPTVAELTAKRASVATDKDLDEAARTAIEQHYTKAIEHLQAASQAASQTSSLKQELDGAAQRITEMQQELIAPAAPQISADTESFSVDAAQARLKELEELLQSAKSRSQQIVSEIERRAARRPQLSDLRRQAAKEVEDANAAIAASPPDGEPSAVVEVRLIRLNVRRFRFEREIELIDQESRTYEGTTRFWTLQRDLADRAVREAEKLVQVWQARVADAQKQQAAKEAMAARRAAADAHPAVKHEAARNANLAQENTTVVTQLEKSQKRLNQVDAEFSSRQEAFSDLKRRAVTAQFSQAIGVLLRNQQAALPDTDELRWNSRQRQGEIAKLNLRLMELDVERRGLVDLDAAVRTVVGRIEDEASVYRDIEENVRATLGNRLTLLGDLIENGNSYLDRLVRLDGKERELIRAIDEESSWLAEHVLWVRSADIIGRRTGKLAEAVHTLANVRQWRAVGAVLKRDLRKAPWWLLGGTIPCAMALLGRGRIKARIRTLGVQAQRPGCVDFLSTLKSSFLTTLLAGPLPLLAWLLGWRLSSGGLGNQFVESVGFGLRVMAGCWLLVEAVRSVSQADGIGEDHFDWPPAAMSSVRNSTHLLLVGLLPASLVVGLVEYLGDEQASVSLGRVAYLLAMAILTLAMYRMFRPSGKVFQSIESHAHDSFLFRFRWLLSGLLIAGPGTLAAMSAVGYHYTAIQLTGRLLASLSFGFAVVFANALASRWLLLTYRRLAIRRAREKRQQMIAQQEAEADQPAVIETTPELKLSDINSQARRVLRFLSATAAITALYVTWVDVLPALGILQKIPLWQNHLVPASDEMGIVWVTAADLLLIVFAGVMTLFAAKNLPGLLEMTVLQRLPLDAGARYAATTVSRYLIFVAGTMLCFHEVGIGWASVQWLIAAMTVGLGFGLQEIFANFVSGIILLFERPIRLGDTVTIGSIHGTVTRIRIRATTIVDWDNKELIVPNREFVTGHLVNWTLTNPTLRLVINVGVAYGSNTRLTTQLLYRVAKENDVVMEDPEPVVVFKEFGDSCLNFELRVFVSGLTAFRRLKHDLHMAIDDLFREHDIEIAFPQRDLHLRSLPAELIALMNPATEAAEVADDEVPVDQLRAA